MSYVVLLTLLLNCSLAVLSGLVIGTLLMMEDDRDMRFVFSLCIITFLASLVLSEYSPELVKMFLGAL